MASRKRLRIAAIEKAESLIRELGIIVADGTPALVDRGDYFAVIFDTPIEDGATVDSSGVIVHVDDKTGVAYLPGSPA